MEYLTTLLKYSALHFYLLPLSMAASKFYFLLSLLLSTTVADNRNPSLFLSLCSRNQTKNPATFDINYSFALQQVASNITQSGFGAASDGTTDTAYIVGQCFSYLSPVDCQLCYAQSSVKLPLCFPAADSRVYIDGCFLRYAGYNFSNAAVDGSDTTQCSNSSAGASNSTLFRENVVRLMSNLTLGAGNSSGYYMAGSTVASPGVTIYGMAQCWRSLNASGCRDCLESGRKSVARCSPGSDGRALNAGCFVRYSTSPFYLVSSSSGGSKAQRRLGAILGSVFGALIAISVAIFWIRRRGTNVTTDGNQGLEGSEEVMRSISASSLTFKYEDLRTATDNFSQLNKLGQGGYGSVYKGVISGGREIAVKRLFFNTTQRADQFFNEVTLINQVQHKNLVKLLGCSFEGPESLLVYEYLCNTSLEKFLFDAVKKKELDWGRRFNIIVGTAEGISYLHNSSQIRIIHRDIKTSNILLDERFRPKVGDFGLAKNFAEDKTHLSTGLAGTFGYMAPEYIVHGQLTEKADIYSYGIVVIEIMTGLKNQNSVSTETDGRSLMSFVWRHFNSNTLIELLDPVLQGQCSDEEVLRIFHVGLLCTQASPTLRPPMWKVVEMLTSSSKDLPLPTQPPFTDVRGADISVGSEKFALPSSSSKSHVSENQITISLMQGR